MGYGCIISWGGENGLRSSYELMVIVHMIGSKSTVHEDSEFHT